jgi:hypothetical protein
MDATSRAGTAGYPSRAPEFTPGFGGDVAVQSLVFCVMVGSLLVGFVWLNLPTMTQQTKD